MEWESGDKSYPYLQVGTNYTTKAQWGVGFEKPSGFQTGDYCKFPMESFNLP